MRQESPEWKFDPAVTMGYLKVTDKPIAKTLERGLVNVDVDSAGQIVGVELFL